jgi:y4mF family transcriptional regulator
MPGQKDWFYCSEKHVIDVATKISKNENILLAENIKAKIQRDVRDVFDIGNIIREKRLELNLTQEQLAGAAGVGERFISEIENGKYRAQIGKLIDVIHVLGIRLTTID